MMVDLHSHFLPEIDDGARNAGESLAMLVESKKQGVHICVGTPHITIHRKENIFSFLEQRNRSISILEKKIKETQKEIPNLQYGAEIFLDNDISLYDDVAKLCIGKTNCLLVELSPLGYNKLYAEWLYSLTMKGFLPIIAHIERYPYIDDFLSELDGVDVIYQMNAKSLLKRSWRSLLVSNYEAGHKIVVSSDMHNTRLRKCRLQEAKLKLEKSYPDIAQEVFCNTPYRLLNITE